MNLIFILFLIYLKIQNGEESFFKIKNIASDYCIDANSASVFTNDCNFLSKTQKWIILMDSETLIHGIKVYQFVNSATSLCLDSDNSNKKVFLNECNKLKYSQNWSLLMQNAINSLCLEGNLDNSLNINNCDKSSFNQKWLLQKEDKINPLETTTNLVKFNSGKLIFKLIQ